jgi:hypothetical protein
MTVVAPMWADCGTTCKCGERLIAPEWSEFVSERLILNLWTCSRCGDRFETPVCHGATSTSTNSAALTEADFTLLAQV